VETSQPQKEDEEDLLACRYLQVGFELIHPGLKPVSGSKIVETAPKIERERENKTHEANPTYDTIASHTYDIPNKKGIDR